MWTRRTRKAKPEEIPTLERITAGFQAALEEVKDDDGQPVAEIVESAAQDAEITAELNRQELTITAYEPENMEVAFNITGERRKALVEAVKAFVDAPAVYQNAPNFVYVIGNHTISKTGIAYNKANKSFMTAMNVKKFIIEWKNAFLYFGVFFVCGRIAFQRS